MKFSNMQVGDLGAGGIVFPQGEVTDIRNYTLVPDQVRSISAAVTSGTLRAEDAEAEQLVGLSGAGNASFALPAGADGALAVDWLASRSATEVDNGKVLVNATAGAMSLTIDAGMVTDFGLVVAQASTGTCTLVAGAGVTFVGTTLVTAEASDVLTLLWVSANTYIVKKG